MKPEDTLRFSGRALAGHRTRTGLMLLAMAISVASVVLLTALGEGARRYVLGEFASLGTNLIIVIPGRNETTGGMPPVAGETPRDLTLNDALALERLSGVAKVAPLVFGMAPVSAGALEREVTIMGSTAALQPVRNLALARGRFLPAGDPSRGEPVAVIGHTLARELFGRNAALGERIRIQDYRFRVVGVLSPEGVSMGTDIGEVAIIPVALAQAIFETESLYRILVQARTHEIIPGVRDRVLAAITARHEGEEDVTVITQDSLLAAFDRILGTLTLAVAGIAGISLGVAGILIMNIMLIAVSQRTAEIGLLKAVGAAPRQIRGLFLVEAALLSLAGAAVGLAVAFAGVWLIGRLYPAFPVAAPAWAWLTAVAVSLAVGVAFGVLPARRAARLDPIQALAKR